MIEPVDAKLHAIDSDTGEWCADFANGGILDINVWNTTNTKWLSILQLLAVDLDSE